MLQNRNMKTAELIRRFTGLKVWRRGSERAPHKPLLLLLSLSRAAGGQTRLTSFSDLEEPLTRLLRDYGPPRKSAHPEYPFWRLQQDGLWEVVSEEPMSLRVSNNDPPRSELRAKRAAGGFTQEVYDQLRKNPGLVAEVAQRLLDANFPSSLHEDILGEVGLSMAAVVRPRDPRFRAEVITAYEHRCAICKFDLKVGVADFGLEAAHIKWHQAGGPDEVPNGIALCVVHHKALDRGVIGLKDDMTVAISAELHGQSWAKEWFEEFKGKPISTPTRAEWHPKSDYVRWHFEQVFRRPPKE